QPLVKHFSPKKPNPAVAFLPRQPLVKPFSPKKLNPAVAFLLRQPLVKSFPPEKLNPAVAFLPGNRWRSLSRRKNSILRLLFSPATAGEAFPAGKTQSSGCFSPRATAGEAFPAGKTQSSGCFPFRKELFAAFCQIM
ncbi:MAG: hypothetical protein IJM90_03685, partial [Firmicutes bacterium]|nr:hypothetical protein [Bacillota bacterium]